MIHSIAAFIGGILALVSGAFAFHTNTTVQPAAAAVAANSQQTTPVPAAPTSHPTSTTTIIYKYIDTPAPASPQYLATTQSGAGVSESELTQKLQGLDSSLRSLLVQTTSAPTYSYSGTSAPLSAEAFAPSQRIDNLNNVSITNATVHGVSGLTASDIPALPYLSNSGSISLTSAYFGTPSTSTFTSAGWLGIGTTSPATALYVAGDATVASTTNPDEGTLYFGNTGASIFYNSSDFNLFNGSFYTDAGRIVAQGADDTQALGTRFNKFDGTYFLGASDAASPDLLFINNAAQEKARLTNSGNFGLGTSSPAAKLEVVDGDVLVTNSTAQTGSLRIRAWNNAGTGVNFDTQADAGNFYFGRDNTLSKLVVQSGNVGIGNTSPTYKFDVTGIGHFTSYVDARNLVATSSSIASIFNGGFLSSASSTITAGLFSMSGGASTTNFSASGAGYFNSLSVGSNNSEGSYGLVVGYSNSANGSYSSVLGGFGNTASNSYASVFGGYGNTASGPYSLAGNYSNTASGNYAVALGQNTTVSGSGSFGIGLDGSSYTVSKNNVFDILGGNVGIGTTSPSQLFSVAGGGYFTGNVGIGTTDSIYKLSVYNAGNPAGLFQTATGFAALVASSTGNSAEAIYARTSGATGATAVYGQADNTQGYGVEGYNTSSNYTCTIGTGSYSITCSGPTNGVSDARLKNIQSALSGSSSLAGILQLQPIVYTWKDAKMAAAHPDGEFGFTAQNVQSVFPLLVGPVPDLPGMSTSTPGDPYLGLEYDRLVVPAISAIQALAQKLNDLVSTITGFADSFTTKQLTFVRATGDEIDVNTVKTKQLCIDDVCVTKTQLQAMLAGAGSSGSNSGSSSGGGGSSDASGTSDTTPPVISISGDNPAHVNIGDTYTDLGATITGPQADLNLGIKTFLNGALVSDIVIDTSTTTTDTIDYVATDSAGNTATSTRTVIVD